MELLITPSRVLSWIFLGIECRKGEYHVSSPAGLVLRVPEAREGVLDAVPLCLGISALAVPGSCGHCRHQLKSAAGQSGTQPLLQGA